MWHMKDVGIAYGGTPGSCTKLSAWLDADFTTCPDTSVFDFRRNDDAAGVRDQLVLEGAEGDRGRVIRIRVCGAGRICK